MVGGKSPIDAFKCQLVCKLFRDSATLDTIYQTMDKKRLRFRPFSADMYEVLRRCRKLNNPYILFNYGMLGEDDAGKQLLQYATDKGQLDAIFVLGMLLMAEGSERKQEALIMLNNAYINTRRCWNLRQTCYKVRSHLDACLVEFAKMFDISLE
ncbi:uncharacterized protein LOC111917456 [Lactuca sativa]|nr:uncharacterized protein LOC111917456 [Lactuca sativa]